MRVLLDCSQLSRGGGMQVAISILENATGTPDHEWHAVLSGALASQFPSTSDRFFASVTRLPVRTHSLRKYSQTALGLPRIERAVRPEVVFTVFGPAKWRARVPHLVGFAIPHVLYPETDIFSWQEGARKFLAKSWHYARLRWVGRAVKKADYLVVETETVRRRMSELHGFPTSRIFVVRNSYSPVFAESLARSAASRAGARFSILVPSAYYMHKNLEIVPSVGHELRSLTAADFEFVMTLPRDGPSWKAIHHRSLDLDVADRIRNAGVVPHRELADWYRRADAVFLPTLLECSTAVYPESFAAGVPLVTSARDFARELCREAALYVDPLSPQEAARALVRLMTDAGLRARLIESGTRVLQESYPSPDQKWQEQLACLEVVAEKG